MRRERELMGNGAAAYLAKVNFIENNLIRMADAPESGQESERGDETKPKTVAILGSRRCSLDLACGLDGVFELGIRG
jgi:hypothetical protein